MRALEENGGAGGVKGRKAVEAIGALWEYPPPPTGQQPQGVYHKQHRGSKGTYQECISVIAWGWNRARCGCGPIYIYQKPSRGGPGGVFLPTATP